MLFDVDARLVRKVAIWNNDFRVEQFLTITCTCSRANTRMLIITLSVPPWVVWNQF